MKELSIIIASRDAEATIDACLSALERQNAGGAAEIIVVDNSTDHTARIIETRFGDVRLVKIPGARLIPQLWAIGARLAVGKVIAFTTAHCVPDENWLAEVLRHHASGYAAVGGAIENMRPSSLLHWAIYFCRYAPYMPPFVPGAVDQIPGDNASYKRRVLDSYADLMTSGFWEGVINARLRRDGHVLFLTPAIRVTCGRSLGMWAFCRQRLTHGAIFAAQRAAAAPSARRLLYLGASPLVPLVVLGRITRHVLQRGRHRGTFLLSLPLVALFVLCWSVGEFLGYLQGGSRTMSAIRGRTGAEPVAHRQGAGVVPQGEGEAIR